MLSISTPASEDWDEALLLLFRDVPLLERRDRVEEMLAAAKRGEISLAGLLTARDGSRLSGAVMYVVQGDGTAFVWPARTKEAASRDVIVDALYRDVAQRVQQGCIVSAQAIVETGAEADRAALSRNRFEHLADLFYLQRPLDKPLPEPPDISLQIASYSTPENADRFARLIEQTYVETLDCPDFHENRSGAEAIASHRCSGDFLPEEWKVFSAGGCDVGLLLMNDHPSQDAWELVYMGVAPAARGGGYGRAMLIEGLHAAKRAGRGSVLLAVDAGNVYANAIYNELGFVEVAARAVHVFAPGSDA